MGLLSRLSGRPADDDVARAVEDAVGAVPGVLGLDLAYHRQPYRGGTLSGVVDVADSPTFLEVLRTCVRVLQSMIGDDTNRVVHQLSGRTPDGAVVQPGDLGLPQPPSGRELISRLSN